MRKTFVFVVAISILASCRDKTSGNDAGFSVSGKLENNSAKMIYLEEVPASSMQPVVVDSGAITNDGKFSLHANPRESVVYNLLFDHSAYPVVSVISDKPGVTLDIHLSKQNNQFPESYDVKGSPASQQLKDFVVKFNKDLETIFINTSRIDSLKKAGAADSLLFPLMNEQQAMAASINAFAQKALDESSDPALTMFELGYYQSTANGAGFGLPAMSDEEVMSIVDRTAAKFPSHQAVAAIRAQLIKQKEKIAAASWVGKEAPDFSLPDANGNTVKLSSFRGKYVLVDFWASWCGPCRAENPNVVRAFQQFKDKNFTILGVSLDKQKDEWQKAIKNDRLAWTQVSDLQYWYSPIVSLYNIQGIPFNVLVDPAGKVVGQELRGRGLEARLAEVLK